MNEVLATNPVGSSVSGRPDSPETPELSILLGGPLYRLWLRTGLARPPLDLLHRRIVAMTLIGWLPLPILALLDGSVANSGILFLQGLGAHVRLLVALPIFIAAERPIHLQLQKTIRELVSRGIVPRDEVPKLNAIIRSVNRVAASSLPELATLILVFTLGQWFWREYWAPGQTNWYVVVGDSGWHWTLAGHWFAFVSVPLFHFIVIRWVLRAALWFWLLWRVARLKLHLVPTHPDRAGGIGFLGHSTYAFSLLLFAVGTVAAGRIAQRILFEGRSLLDYRVDIVVIVAVFVGMALAPFLVFTPLLVRTKMRGRSEYGSLANRYVEEFDAKWVRDAARTDERFVGSADIQSLADMANSYHVVQSMRLVPFSAEVVTYLAVVTVAPLLPLTLTLVPFEKMVDYFINGLL